MDRVEQLLYRVHGPGPGRGGSSHGRGHLAGPGRADQGCSRGCCDGDDPAADREAGGSEPTEVSRLLRFHGTSPLERRLRVNAGRVRDIVAESGGGRVSVFGSVATGQDRADPDVDLLFTMGRPLSLMDLGRLEQRLAEVIGAPVDLVPDSSLRPDLRDRVLAEAVDLSVPGEPT